MASWDDVVRVDQRGTYVGLRCLCAADDRAQSRGSIVNIASIAGHGGQCLCTPYAPGQGPR